jgi:hypothetical protein
MNAPKTFNYSPISITGNYALVSDTFNVVYIEPDSHAVLVLPDLVDVQDGFPLTIRNYGPADVDVLEIDSTFVTNMLPGSTFCIIADKQIIPSEWKVTLGPIGGGSGVPVSGPGLSTNNAVVLWNGTAGSALKNSAIIINGTNDISGVRNITTTGISQLGGSITTTGNLIYSSGLSTTTFANTPSGNNIWTFRNTNDSVVGQNTTDNLTNKTLISSTNNIAANYLNSATTQVRVDAAAAPSSGQALVAINSTSASWQNLPISVSGPITSTVNSVTLWNSTTGNVVKNSAILVDGSSNVTGINNLGINGNASAVNLSITGNLNYNNGGNILSLSAVPTAGRSLILPDASDTLIGRNTIDTLTNKTISYTPATPSNWINLPATVSDALNTLATSAGTFLILGVDSSVTATGNSQGTAYTLTKYFTNVTTAAANTGVILPIASPGMTFVIKNNGGNNLNIYPASSANINALLTNVAYVLNVGLNITLAATSSIHWETLS